MESFNAAITTTKVAQFQLLLLQAKINYVRDELGRFSPVAKSAQPPVDLANFPHPEKFANAEVFDIYEHSSKGRSQIGGVEIDGTRFFVKEVLHDGADEGVIETIASEVAGEMGLADDIIPAQKVIIQGQEFIASHYLPGSAFLDSGKSMRSVIPEAKARQMLLFDFVINNTDRHADNIFLTRDGQVKLIDHGNAMRYEIGAMDIGEPDLVFSHNQIRQQIFSYAPDAEFTEDELQTAVKGVDKLQELAKKSITNPQHLEEVVAGSGAVKSHLLEMIGKGLMKVAKILL